MSIYSFFRLTVIILVWLKTWIIRCGAYYDIDIDFLSFWCEIYAYCQTLKNIFSSAFWGKNSNNMQDRSHPSLHGTFTCCPPCCWDVLTHSGSVFSLLPLHWASAQCCTTLSTQAVTKPYFMGQMGQLSGKRENKVAGRIPKQVWQGCKGAWETGDN